MSGLGFRDVVWCMGAGPGTEKNGQLQKKRKSLQTGSKVFLRRWDRETGGGGAWLVEGE